MWNSWKIFPEFIMVNHMIMNNIKWWPTFCFVKAYIFMVEYFEACQLILSVNIVFFWLVSKTMPLMRCVSAGDLWVSNPTVLEVHCHAPIFSSIQSVRAAISAPRENPASGRARPEPVATQPNHFTILKRTQLSLISVIFQVLLFWSMYCCNGCEI